MYFEGKIIDGLFVVNKGGNFIFKDGKIIIPKGVIIQPHFNATITSLYSFSDRADYSISEIDKWQREKTEMKHVSFCANITYINQRGDSHTALLQLTRNNRIKMKFTHRFYWFQNKENAIFFNWMRDNIRGIIIGIIGSILAAIIYNICTVHPPKKTPPPQTTIQNNIKNSFNDKSFDSLKLK